MKDNDFWKIGAALTAAKEIGNLFYSNYMDHEDIFLKVTKKLSKPNLAISFNNVDIDEIFSNQQGAKLMGEYTCLINPYFSSLKTFINLIQKSIQKKYNLKVSSRKGYTTHFFERLEAEHPRCKELQILKAHLGLIKEIKDMRDKTQHIDPRNTIRFIKKRNRIEIPIYERLPSQIFVEKKTVHFLSYMKKTTNIMIKIFKNIDNVRDNKERSYKGLFS